MTPESNPSVSGTLTKARSIISVKEIPYWTAALLTGLAAVAYATLFKYSEQLSRRILEQHPYWMLALAPLCFLAGWWLVHRFAPEAAGSGIPQVMAAVEMIEKKSESPFVERLLGIRTVVIKILSSTLCVIGGGAVGREGPTIQIAASIFHFVGRKTEKVSKQLNHEFWLITGGAAGIAAAFNTPLGGLVFAIEELATSHFNRFKTSLIAAVIISGLASQWFVGPYLYLGYPKLAPVPPSAIPWALLVGAICGAWGSLFGIVLFKLNTKRQGLNDKKKLALVSIACGAAMALSALVLGGRALGPGREVVIDLLFKDVHAADWKLVLARFFGPVVSYVSGCAGGIFAPSLAAGGALGASFANIVHANNPELFVLLGMIAFLTGVTHAPFTSFVLVLEMTDRHDVILPMMLSAIAAVVIARTIDEHSFYHRVNAKYLSS